VRRSFALIVVVAASALLGGTASADPVSENDIIQLRLTNSDGSTILRYSNGGPFRFDVAGGVGDFLTFCLEIDEFFTPGENLKVGSISTQALNGGLNTDNGDYISGTTAFLYTQFRNGISGYTDGVMMQRAIWHLEGERTGTSTVVAFINDARAQMTAQGWGLDYLGDVRVANLYRGAGYQTYAQDMLIISSVPEPASAMFLGLGLLISARALKRRSHSA
jgi:hypothetical protein